MPDEDKMERLWRLAPVPLDGYVGIFWLDGVRQGYTDGYQAAQADLRPLLEEASAGVHATDYQIDLADRIKKALGDG